MKRYKKCTIITLVPIFVFVIFLLLYNRIQIISKFTLEEYSFLIGDWEVVELTSQNDFHKNKSHDLFYNQTLSIKIDSLISPSFYSWTPHLEYSTNKKSPIKVKNDQMYAHLFLKSDLKSYNEKFQYTSKLIEDQIMKNKPIGKNTLHQYNELKSGNHLFPRCKLIKLNNDTIILEYGSGLSVKRKRI